MQKITQISLFIVITLLLTAFAPLASAEDYTGKQVEINLEPGEQNDSSIVNNIADTSETPLEMDQIYSYLPIGTEGKYYGPYLQSSLFQFATSGGYFQFAINLTIGSDVIMNGVSNLWLRIPVQPSQYNWWHTVITWDERVDSIEIGPDKWYSGMSADALYSLATPFKMEDYVYTGSLWPYPGFFIGNYWSSDSTSNELYIETEYGIFLNLRGTFLPDQQFTISFTGQVKDTVSPRVYLTQELFDDDNYSYRFFEFKKLGTTARFTYDYDIELPLAPAFAFVFLSGIGKWGMTAYEIDFNGTQSLSFYGYEYNSLNSTGSTTTGFRYYDLEGYSNATRLSFYMPFTVVANYDEPQNLDIDWLVTLTMRPYNTSMSSYHPWYFLDGITPTNEVSFYINDTSNYLLFSSPYQIYTPTSVDYCEVILTIKPVQNCTVLFLGNVIESELDGGGEKILQGSYNNNQKARWDGVTDCNVNQLFPIYNSYSFTDTIWAQVTETQLYDIYDFGWGKGYNIPGETTIYIFLDDGGQYIWNGSYAGFSEVWDDRNEPFSLINTIANAIKNLAGFIWDGITYIWDTLVGIGEFIYNIISSFIDFIVTIAKDVISKVVTLIEGFLYGLPIILTLFIVNYAGQMFQTGHMPVPRKEIRKLKKLAKKTNKTFIKPLGRFRNKLKADDARNERVAQASFKRYGDASAKGYVRQANSYARDQNQATINAENLARVGRQHDEKEQREQKVWADNEQRAVEKANKKVEKIEDRSLAQERASELEAVRKANDTVGISNRPQRRTMVRTSVRQTTDNEYLHSVSRDEPKVRTKGMSNAGKARRNFEAMREADLATPIVKRKSPETLSQLEIARRRRELEKEPEQPKREVRKEPKLINDVVREPAMPTPSKPKSNGDSLEEMRELLNSNKKKDEMVILPKERTDEEIRMETLALEKQRENERNKKAEEKRDAEFELAKKERKANEEALQRAKDDELAQAEDKRNQEEYNAEAIKVSEANRKVEAMQKKQAEEQKADSQKVLEKEKEKPKEWKDMTKEERRASNSELANTSRNVAMPKLEPAKPKNSIGPGIMTTKDGKEIPVDESNKYLAITSKKKRRSKAEWDYVVEYENKYQKDSPHTNLPNWYTASKLADKREAKEKQEANKPKESKPGYPEIDESKAYENQRKMMAEADENKMNGEDAKYLRSKGFSDEFIKNGSESDLNRMATIRRDADSARSKLKAHGYSDKEIDDIEQGNDGHKELIKKANRVKKVKAIVAKAEVKLENKETAKSATVPYESTAEKFKKQQEANNPKAETVKEQKPEPKKENDWIEKDRAERKEATIKSLESMDRPLTSDEKRILEHHRLEKELGPAEYRHVRVQFNNTSKDKRRMYPISDEVEGPDTNPGRYYLVDNGKYDKLHFEGKKSLYNVKVSGAPPDVKAKVKALKAKAQAKPEKPKAETAKEIKKDSAKQNSSPDIQLFKYQVKTPDGKTSYTDELAVAKAKAKDNPGSTISESKPGPFNKGNKFYKMKEQKQKPEAPKQAIHERHPSANGDAEWINQQRKDKAPKGDYSGELESLKFNYDNMPSKDKAEFRQHTITNYPETAKAMNWKAKK